MSEQLPSLDECLTDLAAFSRRQFFFVGGAPRSGTTWLQFILDAHPEVSCRGEGFLFKQLAAPVDALMKTRGEWIAAKNQHIFKNMGGYLLPSPEDTDLLIAIGIALTLQRQAAGRSVRAIGEKTPENVFFFPRLKRMFPGAKCIAIARDPRDALASSWHFFHPPVTVGEETAKIEYLKLALPALALGMRAVLEFRREHPGDLLVVTYEALKVNPAAVTKRLYGFLGVADDDAVVADCVARTSFEAMTKGRSPGQTSNGSFFRKGVVGDWRNTLTPQMSELVYAELGWAFETFGWQR